jgi:ribosome-associated protein
MRKVKSVNETDQLVPAIIKGIQEKKGKNIIELDLRQLQTRPTDVFIICHGDSTTQVDAIYNSIEEEVRKELQEKPWHSEGQQNSEWILLDYINVVVHVFLKERRDFYAIEDLWGDAVIHRHESE